MNVSVPVHLLYFKAATDKFPDIWSAGMGVRQMLEREGHLEQYIMTMTAYVNSLLDALHLCAHGVVDHTQFVSSLERVVREYTLDPTQQGIVHLLELCLHQRCHILRTIDEIGIRPILVVCGDHAQQQPLTVIQTDNHIFRL